MSESSLEAVHTDPMTPAGETPSRRPALMNSAGGSLSNISGKK